MADTSLRQEFVDGVEEIFTTMFNDGVTDGINLYLMSDKTKTNIYGESRYKVYKAPKMLSAQARLTPTQGEQDVESIKDNAVFVVPLKSLQRQELGVTNTDLEYMRKGVIEFHGIYYTIENILPKAYIADTFLMYHFICTEDRDTESLLIEEPEIEELPEDEDPQNQPQEPEVEVPEIPEVEDPDELPEESGDSDE